MKTGVPSAMLLLVLVCAALCGGCISGCAKWKKEKEVRKESASPRVEPAAPSPSDLPMRKDLEDLLDRSKPIKAFTPELFVALTIKHRKETVKWVKESKKMSEEDQKKYLENKNKAFFDSYGTTEEAFIQYPQRHMDELNDYIEAHPDLMKELSMED